MRDRDNVSTAKRSTGQGTKGTLAAGTGSKRRESQPSKRQRTGLTVRERFSITTVMEKVQSWKVPFPKGTGKSGSGIISPTPHVPQATGKIGDDDKGKTLHKTEARQERPEETPRLMALSGQHIFHVLFRYIKRKTVFKHEQNEGKSAFNLI